MENHTVFQPTEANTAAINYADYSILLVDDTPNNLDVLIDFLGEYGFSLRVARSGERALERVRYDAPSIILLDVLLPGIDGFQTCRELKADPVTREIPIIFMTSLANAEDKVRGFEVGAVDYVTKPLQQSEVLARITTHLQQRDIAQDLAVQNQQLIQSNQVERRRLLDAVAQQRAQLRTLSAKVNEVQENERRRLARELHDEMGQSLTALYINLAAIDKQIARESLPDKTMHNIRDRLRESTQLVDETLEQIRELSLNLRPATLDDLGLIPTLRWYVSRFTKRADIPVQFTANGFDQQPRLRSTIETALYRMMQEALTNVIRHANASRVELTLTTTDSTVTATVADNGCGFDPSLNLVEEGKIISVGLLGMRERANLLGGSCRVESSVGNGTRIKIDVPRAQP